MNKEIINHERALSCKKFIYEKLLEGPKTEHELRKIYFSDTNAAAYAPMETLSDCFNLAFALVLLVDIKQIAEDNGVFYVIG